jgi:outer membrane biosynthesis protein TonB
MAGSFGVFRQYEKAALAGLAIMAMLAFFVLPPILQMGSGVGNADPQVVSWKGGGLRESGLQRAVLLRRAANQFLVESLAATGRTPSRPPLPDDEKDVVNTLLLAREAEKAGIVVSNESINRFIAGWTNDLVRPDQFEGIVARMGRIGLGQQDVFEALRTVLLADRMRELVMRGVDFSGTPPAWLWDYYRRLEQSATIEAVPVVVEKFRDQVPEPAEAKLRSFFDRYRDELPVARSPDPGFRQPQRARYSYLVAKADAFVAEERPKVTDAAIKDFYEERKAALYRVKEPAKPDAEAATPAPEAKPEPTAEPKPEPKPEAKPEAKPEGKPEAKPEGKDGATATATPFRPAAFRQPAATGGDAKPAPADAAAAKPAAAADAPAAKSAEPAAAAEEKPADKPADDQFEPLDKVADDIRDRLAAIASERRVSDVFDAVKADVGKYGESLALWQVAGDGAGPAPVAPDVAKIAEKQGLTGGTSELVNRSEAFATPGIGGSFEITMSRELGMRQQRWIDMLFDRSGPLLRPIATRDIEGNRYLSWKTEDQQQFVPSFPAARDDVLRAWGIVEARPLALGAAEQLAADVKTGGKSLAEAAAARGGLEVVKAGPFTWLDRGTAPFGSMPELSQPEGLAMPGEDFMRAVFSLEPGEVAVAFNEPKTVCYVLRLVGLEPADPQLRELFLAAARDPRRLVAAAEEDATGVFSRWMRSVEERNEVSWKREPRGSEGE